MDLADFDFASILTDSVSSDDNSILGATASIVQTQLQSQINHVVSSVIPTPTPPPPPPSSKGQPINVSPPTGKAVPAASNAFGLPGISGMVGGGSIGLAGAAGIGFLLWYLLKK